MRASPPLHNVCGMHTHTRENEQWLCQHCMLNGVHTDTQTKRDAIHNIWTNICTHTKWRIPRYRVWNCVASIIILLYAIREWQTASIWEKGYVQVGNYSLFIYIRHLCVDSAQLPTDSHILVLHIHTYTTLANKGYQSTYSARHMRITRMTEFNGTLATLVGN